MSASQQSEGQGRGGKEGYVRGYAHSPKHTSSEANQACFETWRLGFLSILFLIRFEITHHCPVHTVGHHDDHQREQIPMTPAARPRIGTAAP